MMSKWIRVLLIMVVVSVAIGVLPAVKAQSAAFELSSPVFENGGTFGKDQVGGGADCGGNNISPELSWKNAPDGTKSFAVTVYDPDAPTGSGFWHWTIYNTPATEKGLAAGAGNITKKLAPEGSVQVNNDVGLPGYFGPCPPQGDIPHRYVITLYALNADKVPVDSTARPALVGFYLNAMALGKAQLIGYYGIPGNFLLSSPAFKNNVFTTENIAGSFGCTGGNISPELAWKGAPDGTKSFAVTMFDADAPTGSGLWHWAVFNIPASATGLATGAGDPAKKLAPEGSVQIVSDTGVAGYTGPCPPKGDKPHHYVIVVYALKLEELPLDAKTSGGMLGFYLKANALATAALVPVFWQ